MATSLTKSIIVLDSVLRNPEFLKELEDHLPYFVASGKTRNVGVDPATALRFTGDFNGLMRELGYSPKMDYINMRLSGLTNSTDYKGTQVTIQIIDPASFQLHVSTWRAHRRQK